MREKTIAAVCHHRLSVNARRTIDKKTEGERADGRVRGCRVADHHLVVLIDSLINQLTNLIDKLVESEDTFDKLAIKTVWLNFRRMSSIERIHVRAEVLVVGRLEDCAQSEGLLIDLK